jgi:hypothetical protein
MQVSLSKLAALKSPLSKDAEGTTVDLLLRALLSPEMWKASTGYQYQQ